MDYNGPNGVGGALAKSAANLWTNLEWLAWGRNQISGNIPAEIGNLVNLKFLGMDINLRTGSMPTRIGELHQLQELYLSDNKLSGTIPASLGNLTKLKGVDFYSLNKFRLVNNMMTSYFEPMIL